MKTYEAAQNVREAVQAMEDAAHMLPRGSDYAGALFDSARQLDALAAELDALEQAAGRWATLADLAKFAARHMVRRGNPSAPPSASDEIAPAQRARKILQDAVDRDPRELVDDPTLAACVEAIAILRNGGA